MNAKDIIFSTKLESAADYLNLYSKICEEIKYAKFKFDNTIRIAVLASFTANGIKEVLFVKCCGIGLLPDVYVCSYNQYAQEILDKNSGLYRFKPELIIVMIDSMSILGEYYFMPYRSTDDDRKKFIDSQLNYMLSLMNSLKANTNGIIVLNNLMAPLYSPLGILENKQPFGIIEAVECMNKLLREAFRNDSQIFVFDYNSFSSKLGKQGIMDSKMYYLGDMKIDFKHFPALAEEYLAYIKPLKSLNRKCLVLDLDNTLWGGIIGEDGLDGISLGHDPKGKPFLEFQKYVLSLFNRGIILAVNSKNNMDDALEVFRKHPYSILKEEHFASLQINWNDKIYNMKAIAEELNIGMDSIAYIDDDKSNREMIKGAFPEALVVETPEDPSLYIKALTEMNDFNTLQIVKEDKAKGKMYAEQRKRKELEKAATDITEYLKGLETVVTIEKANSFNTPRITQLTQKTNQFNMTTRRYMEEDIKKLSSGGNFLVVCAKVEDKFGDHGIVGASIVEKNTDEWRIDTFLLSCRVIGRKIEEALLAFIAEEARKGKARRLIGEFIPTKKNMPAKSFYNDSGFELKGNSGAKEVWSYDLENGFAFPQFIKIIANG